MGATGRRAIFMTTDELLLDSFSGAAFALSLRQLRGAATLAIRVRRSSDNAEQDIGFSSGNLDTVSLLSFVGAGNGFITKWYDQSVNGNDAIQANNIYQQRIVLSGVVETANGLPAVKGVSQTTGYDTGLTGLSEKSMFCVADSRNPLVPSTGSRLCTSYIGTGGTGAELMFSHHEPTSVDLRYLDGGVGLQLVVARGYHLFTATKSASGLLGIAVDGGSLSTASAGTGVNTLTYGAMEESGGTTGEIPAYMQELIMFSVDQTSNKSGIENDINGYYGVY